MDAIISGLDEVESVVGPLTDVLRSANVQIVHTNGKRPFFTSGAGGLYVSGQHTIGQGMNARRWRMRLPISLTICPSTPSPIAPSRGGRTGNA